MRMLALLQAEGKRQRSMDASTVPTRTAGIEDGSLTMGLFSLEIQKAFLFTKRKVVWPCGGATNLVPVAGTKSVVAGRPGTFARAAGRRTSLPPVGAP